MRNAKFGKAIIHFINTKLKKLNHLLLLDPDNASITILRNVGNYLAANTA